MSYYRTCPLCGAHLDPGESCDCVEREIISLSHKLTKDERIAYLERLRKVVNKK